MSHDSIRANKLIQAERILLTILRLDKKNAAAYNRIGILYARQKEYDDAINCFEIACTLHTAAETFHNLGLAYYEIKDYDKALLAFKRALELDSKPAIRYLSFAKVLERLDRHKEMFEALEKAAKSDPDQEILNLLKESYLSHGQKEKADKIQARLDELIVVGAGRRR